MSKGTLVAAATVAALSLALVPSRALAHCDTMNGPVVKDAQAALAKGDVTPVLRWVTPDKEREIREAFQHTLTVRALGPAAQKLADRFFFETLVRIHREGEGAPYTGLKPAGVEIEPAIAASDKALDAGSVDALATMVTTEAEHGIRERFARAAEAKMHASESVERGRVYVAAYVEFMHYVERLHNAATTVVTHAEHEAPHAGGHQH
jgi:Family of unknown function (DUF6448)